MNSTGEAFLTWAKDTSRTKEERFAILLLGEELAPDPEVYGKWDKKRPIMEARRYDAAYQPVLRAEVLEQVAEKLPTVTRIEFNQGHGIDRPLRDACVLRFLPVLQELVLWEAEITSLEPLRHCQALRKVRMRCNELEDYSPLAACQQIEELDIQTWHPWPDISALRLLPRLTKLSWNSPGHKLESCKLLPQVRELVVDGPGHHDELVKSVRDFHQLPEMPELRRFWGGSFYRLDGVERYPHLRSLRVIGFFKDLSPLATLPELTHARVASHYIESVEPLVRSPKLFQLVIKGRRPQDYTPLMDAPALHELHVLGCELPQPDIEMTRLMLPLREECFALDPPRPLEPLRLIVDHSYRKKDKDVVWPKHPSYHFAESEQPWDDSPFMRQSEVFWMNDLVNEALQNAGLAALQGVRRGYYKQDDRDSYHLFHSVPSVWEREVEVHLMRTEAISRLREVVDCLRPLLARTRWPWSITIQTDPEPEAEVWDDREDDQSPQARFQEMLEEEARDQHNRDLRNRLLADEHRLKLLEEGGDEAGDYIPSPLPLPRVPETLGNVAAPPKPDAQDPAEKDWSSPDDDDEGGIAEADPDDDDDEDEHWLPPVHVLNPNIRWDNLNMTLLLTETGIWTANFCTKDCEYLLDVKAEFPPGYDRGEEE